MKWHMMDVDNVLKELATNKKGLSKERANKRLKEYGFNRIESESRRTSLVIFLEQFKSILVMILLFAVILSVALGLYVDATAIAIIIVLNASMGFYQEHKAEKAIEELRKLIVSKVTVLRSGDFHEITTEKIVPGDIVLLGEGSRIPADMRLFQATNLKIDESMLTGESAPILKNIAKMKDVEVSERKNMAFAGTLVSYGRGKGIVVATGMSSEMGKIASLVQQKEEDTPLQRKLQNFGKTLGVLVAVLAIILFSIGLMIGEDMFNMFLTAMSLAISAVPEGLPAVITLTLAIGTQKMLKRNSAVKRLSAVEALGSVTVICADKTGTMTTNEMTVRKIWVPSKTIEVTGVGFEPKGDFLIKNRKAELSEKNLSLLLSIADKCNDAILKEESTWRIIGDPTEGALKVVAKKAGIANSDDRISEIPFSSERKIMTTIHKRGKNYIAYSKGAPEKIISICSKFDGRKFDKKEKDKVMSVVKKFAAEGLRVLAFSYRDLKNYKVSNVESDMRFVGLAAMIDPPRRETKEAIRLCKQAGIKVLMLTGDYEITAKAIADEIGLKGKSITGENLNSMSDKELEEIVDEIAIYSRVSPQDKLRIVTLLRKKGHIVAVTGDGVNDAPALKKAEIGIAVGMKGTDVAKEASDMILLDDNFYTIVHAIKEGRRIYDNIKKFVRFLLSSNFDEIIIVTTTMLLTALTPLNLPLPFLPIQILWINLITDSFPALSLGLEPAEKDIMKKKPRDPKESIISSSIPFIFVTGIVAFLSSFTVFLLELNLGAAQGLPAELIIKKARTMAFTVTILFEMFFVLNCRFEKKSVFGGDFFTNKKLLASIALSVFLQVMVIYVPFLQAVLGTVSLNALDWVKIIIFSSFGLFILPEAFNWNSKKAKRKV